MRNIEIEMMKKGAQFVYPIENLLGGGSRRLVYKTFEKFIMDSVREISWAMSTIIMEKHEKNNL
jgi:hypothetical protein